MKKILAAAALVVAVPAQAGFYSGNELYNKLTSQDTIDRIFGMAYIAGVHDSLENVMFCTPKNAQLGQIKDIVLNKLRQSPEIRHFSAESLVAQILGNIYPCKNRNSS